MTNREQLHALMDEHNLTPPKIASMLGVQEDTVRHWLADTRREVEIPGYKLELLRFKLQQD